MIPYASTLAKMPEDSWTDIVLNKMPAEGDNSGYIQLTALMHGAYLILCLDHRRESRVDDSYTKLTHGTMVLTLQMGKIMSIQTGRDSGDDDSWTPGSRTYIQSQLPEWDAFKPALHRVDLLEEQIGTLQGFTSTLIEAGKPIANFDIVSE